MPTWEYEIYQVTKHEKDMVAKLNALGKDRWEWVVALEDLEPSSLAPFGSRKVLFKRQLLAD